MRSICLVSVLASGLLVMPARAVVAGQASSVQPVAEVGVSLSQVTHARSARLAIAPRVSFRVGRRTTLEGAFDRQAKGREAGFTDIASVQIRQTVHIFDRGRVFAGLGGARAARTVRYQDSGYGFYAPRVVEYHGVGYSLMVGAGLERELTRFLAVRADVQFIPAADVLRATAGISVPVGLYQPPADRRAARLAADHPLAGLRKGQTVWVTLDDGTREEAGFVAASADDITFERPGLVRRVPLAKLRQVERADGVRDGAATGAWVGAASGAALGLLAIGGCEGNGCLLGLLVGTGVFAGLGALVGVIGDAVLEHPRTIFGGPQDARERAARRAAQSSTGSGGPRRH